MKKLDWHTLSVETLEGELSSNLNQGLTESEAESRRKTVGPNELPEAAPTSALTIFLNQFSSVIVWVLLGAAVVSSALDEWIDAAAIIAIVVVNAILGFIQEYRAERSLAALKKLSVARARVIRGGVMSSIPARDVVPGDLIHVEAGDRIPADSRLIYAAGLQTQEASLTGESTPVAKSSEPIKESEAAIADRHNMVFMSTVAVSGKGRALVTSVGIQTEVGRIATMIGHEATAEREETPLQRRLEQLGHTLLWWSLGIVGLVFLLGTLRGLPPMIMFLTAVSLAVAAIPEGLPAVVTVTLALGVTRMVQRHALIRRLPVVETLGSTTVICSDKTGTLTKNEMTVTTLYQGGETWTVSGEGYAPIGQIRRQGEPATANVQPGLTALLEAGMLCNGAELRLEAMSWHVIGDPTEGALLVVGQKMGLSRSELERDNTIRGEVPFDSDRKKMTVVRETKSGPVAYIKGAPDVILHDCSTWLNHDGLVEPLTDPIYEQILSAIDKFSGQALRVLGLAVKPLAKLPNTYSAELEKELTFLGLVGMKDPIRPEAKLAVSVCGTAGIRTVMITGDHKDTAVAIAEELGIFDKGMTALAGAEINHLSDTELEQRVASTPVYARVSAEHKLRVVQAWRRQGGVVAMTGDGVNDAPALKAANIGVAMGITGTDVTKEASDMVVTDDNFASIAAAVEEGRGVYDNIRKAVQYLLSCNISEIILMLLATLLGFPLPLLPVQILWINLVTDGLPALALAVDPKDPDLMHRPPRPVTERFLTKERFLLMIGQGTFLAILAISSFMYCLYGMDLDLERARTLTFTIVVISQLVHSLNCRNDRRSIFAIGLFSNEPLLWAIGVSLLLQVFIVFSSSLHPIFRVTSFDGEHWLLAFGLGLLPLAGMEVWKALRTRS